MNVHHHIQTLPPSSPVRGDIFVKTPARKCPSSVGATYSDAAPDGAGEFYRVSILQRCRAYGAAVGERFSSGFLCLASLRLCAFALNPIPVPPLAEQRALVVELETERALVEANRELAVRFEQKLQTKLSEIWGTEAAK